MDFGIDPNNHIMDDHYPLVAFIIGTAAYIIWDCCIYYVRLLHILYGTAAFIIWDCYIYYMGLLHLLYGTAAFITVNFLYFQDSTKFPVDFPI